MFCLWGFIFLNKQNGEIVREGAVKRCHGSIDEFVQERNKERWDGDEPGMTYKIAQLRKEMLTNPHS